ncbi:MAG TPA: hypothetical protein VHE35_09315 [Kofleriaceae bacterium]|nr:hypothetical protein [Kofleriaceae bacterium]
MIRTDLPVPRWRASWLFRLALVATCAGAAALVSCSTGNSGIPQCVDGIDNDSDGFIDADDPACQANPDGKESEDPPHACEDGIDNDGDGFIDFPADPNCDDPKDQDEFGPLLPQCMDGRDNDGDGKMDYPDDPGCLVPNQNSEVDDCPDGPNCPECGNGVDDDFDNAIDYPGDPGCTAASDPTEFDLNPTACGPGVSVTLLPQTMTVNGTIPAANSQQMGACGGVGAEVAYVVMVPRRSTLVATTTGNTDTVVYVRRACSLPATELACNDNNPDAVPVGVGSKVTVDVDPGSYFIVVDGKGLATSGPFTLTVNLFVGEGETCSAPGDCAPGYVCRTVPGAPDMTCERPVCSDGRDDDNDGTPDFPGDPGCTAPDDSTEDDDCPNGPNCPACGNQQDDDGDGLIDYPNDPSCASASSPSEADCPVETDPITMIAAGLTMGNTTGAGNQFGNYSCQSDSDAPDRVHMLAVRAPLQTLVVDLSNSGFDTILNVYDALCATSLACDDDGGDPGTQSKLTMNSVAVGTYAIVVDGFSNASGAYQLQVSGTYAAGAACDPLSPWFTCPAGNACVGAPGSATCTPAQCNDHLDNDGDGKMDFPADPGCTSANDATEADDCPNGPNCPQCGNQVDDDGDGQTDYPNDSGCSAASTTSESCVTTDPVRPLTQPTLMNQSTAALANDFDLSCGLDGRDEVYRVRVDHPVDMLRVDTIGSALDTVVAIKAPACNANDLTCDDNGGGGGASQATLVAPSMGDYFVIVDDRGVTNPGTYNVHVTGHYLDHGRCEVVSPFTCNPGFSCQGAPGAETCNGAACNDLADNDGDGHTDFPSDPGCTSTSDNDETDDCPNGPNCPACSNGLDDDGDGFTDYPNDPACTSASTNSELAPCTSMDPVLLFTQNVQGATTANKANDIALTCGANGRDDIYRILVNQPLVSLTVDTFASDTATAVGIRRGTCNGTTDLACGTNNFGTNDAKATITNVTPGEYFAVVDDLNTATPTLYNLNVKGVLAGMAHCDPASNIFVCDAGFTCLGPPGNAVCSPGACNDNVDSDGDGRVGFPDDPGCTSPTDTDEADDCNLPNGPPGPNCPVCSNGMDDDNDGMVDYPNDLGCTSASGTTEIACAAETDPVLVINSGFIQGTTAGAANNFGNHSCQGSSTAPDRTYLLFVRQPLASLTLDLSDSAMGTTDFDSIIDVYDATCSAPIAGYCDDDGGDPGTESKLVHANVPAGTYAVVIDGYLNGSGPFAMHVSGSYAAGAACDAASPWFTCPAGQACTGGTCQ